MRKRQLPWKKWLNCSRNKEVKKLILLKFSSIILQKVIMALSEIAEKYVNLLKQRLKGAPIDWSPVEYLGSPVFEYKTENEHIEITAFKKFFLKRAAKLRVFVIPLKVNSPEECLEIVEKVKPKFEVELYSIIVFVGHKSSDGVVNFVETFNHPSASLFLVEPETGLMKKDYKSITKNYLQWIDPKAAPMPTKERLLKLAQQNGKKTILTVEKVREYYNYTHGQALDFLHSCKFLKRDGLTENYIFK